LSFGSGVMSMTPQTIPYVVERLLEPPTIMAECEEGQKDPNGFDDYVVNREETEQFAKDLQLILAMQKANRVDANFFPLPTTEQGLKEMVRSSGGKVYVARLKNEIVGFLFAVTKPLALELTYSDDEKKQAKALADVKAIIDYWDTITVTNNGHKLKNSSYCLVVQLCVAKDYDRDKVGRQIFEKFKMECGSKFNYLVSPGPMENVKGLGCAQFIQATAAMPATAIWSCKSHNAGCCTIL